ncbi:hypothetical protein C8R44DRAFT_51065 [Mycena epipterygia]|nr:hypothetical protein C8R44DRAFT_51065 [Mycena epipterygia]
MVGQGADCWIGRAFADLFSIHGCAMGVRATRIRTSDSVWISACMCTTFVCMLLLGICVYAYSTPRDPSLFAPRDNVTCTLLA